MQGACTVLDCHLWPIRLYILFTHYRLNITIFGKGKVIEFKMYVFILSASFLCNVATVVYTTGRARSRELTFRLSVR